MSKNTKFGALYIVATPIGNLEDISQRALNILSQVSLCAVEDTRKSKILMNEYNLKTKLISYEKFSEQKKLSFFISLLKQGEDIALISDAGTPLISDPGYLLVNRSLEEGIKVIPIPGPSSLISAISVSGLPIDNFVFYGFPPRQKNIRKTFIRNLMMDNKTSVIFESKNRIKGLIQEIESCDSKRDIFLAREMTKLHESFYRGKPEEVLKQISLQKKSLKGEFVLVIKGVKEQNYQIFLSSEQRRVLEVLIENMKKNEALTLASKLFGIKKNTLYKFLLDEK